jgi:hypothetical protein
VALRKAASLLGAGVADSLPESSWYSVKRHLLGLPLVNEQLRVERLWKPFGLDVLSCDGISSADYGSELIRSALPVLGIGGADDHRRPGPRCVRRVPAACHVARRGGAGRAPPSGLLTTAAMRPPGGRSRDAIALFLPGAGGSMERWMPPWAAIHGSWVMPFGWSRR